jgi:hypothetical protein
MAIEVDRNSLKARIVTFLGDGPYSIADVIDFVSESGHRVALDEVLRTLRDLRSVGLLEFRIPDYHGGSRPITEEELQAYEARYRALEVAGALRLPDPLDLYVDMTDLGRAASPQTWRVTFSERPRIATAFAQTAEEAEEHLAAAANQLERMLLPATRAVERVASRDAPTGLSWANPGVRLTYAWIGLEAQGAHSSDRPRN